MKAATHPRQSERLAALRSYEILDTPRESDFDDIVELASMICGAPISVINLVDMERQWFKAEVGLGIRETPLDTSLCSHAILESDFVEVTDTLLDRRMQDNALCKGNPGLRFYAGAILQTDNGMPLGTLCVLDYKPRTLSPQQRRAMLVLAKQVMRQLDLRMALRRHEVLQKEIDHRVKNSLQSVISLVHLQQSSLDSSISAHDALTIVGQRISTIALLHEQLYHTSTLDTVDLSLYLPKLCGLSDLNTPPEVVIDVTAESIHVDSGRASAVGIIVSEFVTNSLKYAFPENRAGRISIALSTLASGRIQLLCADDGIGIRSPGSLERKRKGLGLRIIEASASKLHGKAEFDRSEHGYRLRVVFG